MNYLPRLLFVLLLAGAAALSLALFVQRTQEDRLTAQLQQLEAVLREENQDADRRASNALSQLKLDVARNQNPAADVRLRDTAAAFADRTHALLDLLRQQQQQFVASSEHTTTWQRLTQPGAAAAVAQHLGPGTAARQALEQQVAAYVAARQRLHPTDSLPAPTLPPLEQLPAAAALTALTRLETDLLLGTQRAIAHLNGQVGSQRLPTRVAAVATAEAAVVAPGDTYRAQLLLLSHFVLPGAAMTCNGQPIPVSTDGVGQVRFRAPTRPGPATWTGTVRLNYNGRDTTFRTVVNYRVARR